MSGMINVFSWTPEKSTNFGDYISPMIVQRLAKQQGISVSAVPVQQGPRKLLAVGSIIQFAEAGDHIWGAGVNGKTWLPRRLSLLDLTIHSVRGPISRKALQGLGHDVSEHYGDPGLLFPILFHEEIETKKREIVAYYEAIERPAPESVFIPNVNDERFYLPEAGQLPAGVELISPRSDPVTVAAYIALAQRVVSSSLHGIVFADANRKPTTFTASRFEALLKYDDYFLGTGRDPVYPSDPSTGLFSAPNVPDMKFDIGDIADRFPLQRDTTLILGAAEKPPLVRAGEGHYIVDPKVLGEVYGWIEWGDGERYWTHRIARLEFATATIPDADALFLYGDRLADDKIPELLQVSVNGVPVAFEFVFRDDRQNWKIVVPLQEALAGSGSLLSLEIDCGADAPARLAHAATYRADQRVSLMVRKIVISCGR